MVKVVLDTCILIDFLQGVEVAHAELRRHDGAAAISVVTWIEVMVGAGDTRMATRAFLDGFPILPLTEAVAERAVDIRRRTRVRLPDAVIKASADLAGAVLVTRNTKDFDPADPSVLVPYTI
ncbi:type II toxin-antitoxin system VapC family toxin [Mongoliimonas terrestris]|uniref:type II toxin-antitoxin system VapC family toxin n=1 Tax=Mongoliimonas terrestris TaxID=1709001 RepID=UPI0009497BEE|nr:type II toxin-antitoxin system VapC family toxin [Mongoliimonas terrestris]